MSKTWYPVIDYENCIECGTCIQKCAHGVYDKSQELKPVVVFPDGCVQGCHGCGNLCPQHAIKYVSDNDSKKGGGCCCG